ncbi:flagellar filament capping protein FliD [Caldinitratiruptor microaerophilus]|uniref:Flagellar hook-associated protein 2 n=1 Tax=Caldinitratiruptor microaerophilus TaxID=671077 RepID=A0AA35CQ11_9FIRM|nr:flagellar filament capping protein FliD [Caldinitratiruptor microaerophilus]BDG61735.1 flagellar hook-associated protein 2 [Caldinitratiruptor microaerophilus]
MSLRISGLYSGLDTETMISELMKIERRPLDLMEQRQHTYELRQELWNEIQSRLLSLKGKVDPLAQASAVTPVKATSTDEGVVRVQVADAALAVTGTYAFEVYQLATAHRVWSDAKPGWTATSTGSFTISDGVNTATITVNAGATLADVARAINGAVDTTTGNPLRIKATVVDNILYLEHELTGTGTDRQISFSGDLTIPADLGLTVSSTDGTPKYQAASQDAYFRINGLPDPADPSKRFSRKSNTGLTDVIAGLSIDLVKAGAPATATVTVARDVDAAVATIRAWVDEYNATLDLINTRLSEQPVADAATDTDRKKGLLRGDFLLTRLKGKLREVVSDPVTRSPATATDRLAAIGITTTADDFGKSGKLQIDETRLRAALESNPADVAALFSQSTDVNGDGKVTSDEQGAAVRLSSLLDSYTTSATRSVNGITVKTGIIPAQLDELQRVIDDYDRRMEAFQQLLGRKEETLRRQFLAMETALATLQNQATYLAQQLASLTR